MKKFFYFFLLFCFYYTPSYADVQEVGSMVAAEDNAAQHNRELLRRPQKKEFTPKSKEEFIDFLKMRLDRLDVSSLPKGARWDKPSSYSQLDPIEEKKSFWEEIYDDALARVDNESSAAGQFSAIDYYSDKTQEKVKINQQEKIPVINIKMPDGMPLKAPAYEHIPVFSSQIEILPNRMIKVRENITVIANGEKIKEGLVRFITKHPAQQKSNIQVILDSVLVNETDVPYKLVERNDDFIITPVKMFDLVEGVYTFEFNYLVDNYLWDYGDYYEFYWDVTGTQFNLITSNVIASIKLPGREPAVKRYVLTGKIDNLEDDNAVVKEGDNNTLGFVNLKPIEDGEGMYIFMTFPKIDFLSITLDQKIMSWIEMYGDIIFASLYLIILTLSCWFSWIYISKKLKFKNINFSSPLLARLLWRDTVDKKTIGCEILDLFRKNLIDIQQQDNDVVLIRKTAHAKHLPSLEHKLMNLLFSKKDSICKFSKPQVIKKLKDIVKEYSITRYHTLCARLSGLYILFTLSLLLVLEVALILWKNNSVIAGILGLADILVFLAFILYHFRGQNIFRKAITYFVVFVLFILSGLLLCIYLHPVSALMILSGILITAFFIIKISGPDALLKNAVQSVYKYREYLSQNTENIINNHSFAIQQPYIYALDLEDSYIENSKIKDIYRLDKVTTLLNKL